MTTDAGRAFRDHPWLLAGVVAFVAAALALVAILASRADSEATPGGARSSPAPAPDRSTSTKSDRLPIDGLLPNLVVLPAEELGITGRGDRRVLRFASVLSNVGVGPLQITPVAEEVCPPRQRYVAQTLFLDADADGAFDRRTDRSTVPFPGGCMVFHPAHEHWHFDSSAAYTLTAPEDDVPLVAREKVSFCLRDSEPLRGAATRGRRAYADCARDRRQGITTGWADRYDASLPGQRLELPPGLADGSYCLRLEVDPFDLLRESDETDNSSAVVVRLTGRDVTRDPARTC